MENGFVRRGKYGLHFTNGQIDSVALLGHGDFPFKTFHSKHEAQLDLLQSITYKIGDCIRSSFSLDGDSLQYWRSIYEVRSKLLLVMERQDLEALDRQGIEVLDSLGNQDSESERERVVRKLTWLQLTLAQSAHVEPFVKAPRVSSANFETPPLNYTRQAPPRTPDISLESIVIPTEPAVPAHFPSMPDKLELPVHSDASALYRDEGGTSFTRTQIYKSRPVTGPVQPPEPPIYSDPPPVHNNSAGAPNHLKNPS